MKLELLRSKFEIDLFFSGKGDYKIIEIDSLLIKSWYCQFGCDIGSKHGVLIESTFTSEKIVEVLERYYQDTTKKRFQ